MAVAAEGERENAIVKKNTDNIKINKLKDFFFEKNLFFFGQCMQNTYPRAVEMLHVAKHPKIVHACACSYRGPPRSADVMNDRKNN